MKLIILAVLAFIALGVTIVTIEGRSYETSKHTR